MKELSFCYTTIDKTEHTYFATINQALVNEFNNSDTDLELVEPITIEDIKDLINEIPSVKLDQKVTNCGWEMSLRDVLKDWLRGVAQDNSYQEWDDLLESEDNFDIVED